MNIPDQWTFKSEEVASGFDNHVREQLPWYDLATRAVVHLGRHYIPRGGTVYDIGASTGNIGRALKAIIEDRNATLIAIEESQEMAERYSGGGKLVIANAAKFPFEQYDFAVAFLTMMFFPVAERREWLNKMRSKIRPGGALVIVDKVTTPAAYVGTALRRLALLWKLEAGTSPEAILKKELSLAGYQRPLCPRLFDHEAEKFFHFGEFAGWITERGE